MSEIEDRIGTLEARVAELKDWRQKYEDGQKELKRLKETYAGTEKLRAALVGFLDLQNGPRPAAGGKETINLTEKELTVNLSHEETEVGLTTKTVTGKVVFCGLQDLAKEGFSEAALSGCLKERGWNVGHSTLAPTLGGLVKDGYLIRLEGKPAKYRLPTKLTVRVENESRT